MVFIIALIRIGIRLLRLHFQTRRRAPAVFRPAIPGGCPKVTQ